MCLCSSMMSVCVLFSATVHGHVDALLFECLEIEKMAINRAK